MDIRTLRSVGFTQRGHHPHGFADALNVSVHYDVLPQLAGLTPDVVIAQEMGARTAQAAVYRAFRRTVRLFVLPCIATSGFAELRPGLVRRALRNFILRRADAVLANGRSGAECARRFGYKKSPLYYVPYATDTAAFDTAAAKSPRVGSVRLVYVGQLIPRKGLLPFADHLKQWAVENGDVAVRWDIVGRGELRDALSQLSPPANLSITLSGSVPYSRLKEIYADADIMVFPTLADEWGQVVTEAMACRVPVLGSVFSQAVEEMVTEGITGWLFRPTSAASTLAALDRAMRTPAKRVIEMGEAAREAAMALSPETLADRVIRAIETLP